MGADPLEADGPARARRRPRGEQGSRPRWGRRRAILGDRRTDTNLLPAKCGSLVSAEEGDVRVSAARVPVATALLSLALLHCSPAPAHRTSAIDAVFAEYDRPDSPGCAVGVIEDGELVFGKGYGMASLELGVPATTETVYYVGSVSKQLVAASVALAARQGQLALDDDIRQHLPEMPDYGTPVTVRHLIHHTSGLRDYLALMWMAGMRYEDVHPDEEIIALVARQKALNFEPGEEYLYSNSGYFLLAEIVRRATGRTLREFAQENIFGPLGMTHTRFHDDRAEVVPDRAMAYEPDGEDGFRLLWYLNFDKVGSGGLLTTVDDLVLWDRNFYSDALGAGGLVEQLLERGVLNDGTVLDYAFALEHGKHRGLPTVAHAGAFMGFRAQLLRFPEERVSVAALCNLASTNPDRLAREVADIVLRDRFPEQEAPSLEEASPAFVHLSDGMLEQYRGGYRDREDQTVVRIATEDGQLVVTGAPLPLRLSPLSETRFRSVEAPSPVELELGSGEADLLLFVGGRLERTFDAVALVEPSPEELEVYEGRYVSEELETTYTLMVAEGALSLQRGRLDPIALEATVRHEFQTEELRLVFDTPERDGPAGLTAHAGRVRNVRFERLRP